MAAPRNASGASGDPGSPASPASTRSTREAHREPYRRDESSAHRLDRNYAELLQELRVAQTGVQILFAFLLAIAFQQRFGSVSEALRVVYIVSLVASAVATILLIAPVATHRWLFGQHRKDEIVELTSRLATIGLVFLALGMLGSVLFVVSFVVNWVVGASITLALALAVLAAWVALPARARDRGRVDAMKVKG
jgi:hypothetical protein